MKDIRWLSPIMLALAALQAWDSGAFSAPSPVPLLVLPAIALPALAVLGRAREAVVLAVLAASIALLALARVVAPEPLPELLLAGATPALLWLLARQARAQRAACGAAR